MWEKDAWNNKDALALAWRGSGWARVRIAQEQTGANPLAFSSVLENRFNKAAEDLNLYGSALLHYVDQHDGEHLPKLMRNPGVSYVAAMLEFLPGYWRDPAQRDQPPFPCHSPGGFAGPIPWPGIDALHQHLRHLFLDGWLSLWKVDDELYLQPASLALLYWAARRADKPFTEMPKQFIEHYAWDHAPWFGGYLKGEYYV